MSENDTKLGVAPNVAGLLCYVPLCCVGFLFSIAAVVVEKENKFVRFHGFQSLLLHAVSMVFFVGMQIFGGIVSMASGLLAILVWGVSMLTSLALLGLCVFLMIKASSNETFKLPVIGDMAEKWV